MFSFHLSSLTIGGSFLAVKRRWYEEVNFPPSALPSLMLSSIPVAGSMVVSSTGPFFEGRAGNSSCPWQQILHVLAVLRAHRVKLLNSSPIDKHRCSSTSFGANEALHYLMSLAKPSQHCFRSCDYSDTTVLVASVTRWLRLGIKQ